MKTSNKNGVAAALRTAAMAHCFLTVGVILCVAASVAASLLPPLLLARCIDSLTAGLPLTIWAVLAYFAGLALEGVLSSAQESLLVVFGQKMTHALRSEMSHKLTRLPAATLVDQNPGEVAARFSGDVDTVEALFTSGIISMVADACRIISIMVVIFVKNHRPGDDFAAGAATVCGVHPPCAKADAGRPAGQPPRCGRRFRPGARDAAQHPHDSRTGHGSLHGAPL